MAVTHILPWESRPRSSLDRDTWELYHTAEDFSCANDLAAKYPEKLKEMQAAFLAEEVKYNVLPLDDSTYARFNADIAGLGQAFQTGGDVHPIPVDRISFLNYMPRGNPD
jgi:hypothetical protein